MAEAKEHRFEALLVGRQYEHASGCAPVAPVAPAECEAAVGVATGVEFEGALEAVPAAVAGTAVAVGTVAEVEAPAGLAAAPAVERVVEAVDVDGDEVVDAAAVAAEAVTSFDLHLAA